MSSSTDQTSWGCANTIRAGAATANRQICRRNRIYAPHTPPRHSHTSKGTSPAPPGLRTPDFRPSKEGPGAALGTPPASVASGSLTAAGRQISKEEARPAAADRGRPGSRAAARSCRRGSRRPRSGSASRPARPRRRTRGRSESRPKSARVHARSLLRRPSRSARRRSLTGSKSSEASSPPLVAPFSLPVLRAVDAVFKPVNPANYGFSGSRLPGATKKAFAGREFERLLATSGGRLLGALIQQEGRSYYERQLGGSRR